MNVSVVGIAAVLTGGGAADVAPPTTIQTRFRRVFQRKRYHHARRACFSSVDCLCFARPLSSWLSPRLQIGPPLAPDV